MATAIGVRSMISKHITNKLYPSVTAIVFDAVRFENVLEDRLFSKHNNLRTFFVRYLFYYSISIMVVSLAVELSLNKRLE